MDALRAAGQTRLADLVAAMTLTPGVGRRLRGARPAPRRSSSLVYVLSSLFVWAQDYLMAGVTQRTISALREDVDIKLGRLPLRYFDTHARGDVLSRVTNDIDNISTTLQQTLTQLDHLGAAPSSACWR